MKNKRVKCNKNFIDDMTSFEEVSSEMKKIGANYIKSEQIEARLLADWMYRFGVKIEMLSKKKKKKKQVSEINRFVKTLELASKKTEGSKMRFI